MAPDTANIYSATYSNVPVYEFNIGGNHVMRRRADNWINATHILKVAGFDKPARTRILEREVQKGVHEKVQGGYGKYQGTWVPLPEGYALAQRNEILPKLLPIFDFTPGDQSPPPAPKHATAARPKAARVSAASRKIASKLKDTAVPPSQISEETFENLSAPFHDNASQDLATVVSESLIDDQDIPNPSQFSVGSRKRKRSFDQVSINDQQHQIWADSLLDYFMLLESHDRFPAPPEPPPNVDVDRPIDDKGHSALHWAASMGDVEVVKDLIRRGARIDCLSNYQETPLMRAVMFTNNHDKDTMPKLISLLLHSVAMTDWFGSTVFHHISATTSSQNKCLSARNYLEVILNKMTETWSTEDISRVLDAQDQNGDTALMIAARNGARKCVRSLIGRNVATDTVNILGESADDLIRDMNGSRNNGRRFASSSPFQPQSQLGVSKSGFASSINLTQASSFTSETAKTVKTKVIPAILEKCEQLAAAYDAELEEKEAERADAERVARKRQLEVDVARAQIAELVEAELTNTSHQSLEAELAALTAQSIALVEIEQRFELAQLVSEHGGLSSNQPVAQPSHDSEEERFSLAVALYRSQMRRRDLVRELVLNQSIAGIGERQREYKRLITGALKVREEDVDGMLPEILGELEEAKERERLEASPV